MKLNVLKHCGDHEHQIWVSVSQCGDAIVASITIHFASATPRKTRYENTNLLNIPWGVPTFRNL
jgi:hypothetical protein